MLKKFLVSSALCVVLNGISVLGAATFEGLNNPESVFVKDKSIFVSNINGGGPLAKDGDGYISKFNKNGKVVKEKFIDNLDAPKGLNAIGNTLYVADIDRVLGFNIKNGKKLFEINIDGAKFLNDIVATHDEIFVSDTGTGKIYKIDAKTNEYEVFTTLDIKFGAPNGLLKICHNLFVVGYDPSGKVKGAVVAIHIRTKKQTPLTEGLGALDGIELHADKKHLLVSDWVDTKNGVIYQVPLSILDDISLGKPVLKKADLKKLDLPAMAGPADMYRDGENLYIPKMLENSVSVVTLQGGKHNGAHGKKGHKSAHSCSH